MDPLIAAKRAAYEREAADPVGTRQIKILAERIKLGIGDRGMHDAIPWKAAEAVLRHGVSLDEIREVLNCIARKRDGLNSSGAYFSASFKRILAKHGLTWELRPITPSE